MFDFLQVLPPSNTTYSTSDKAPRIISSQSSAYTPPSAVTTVASRTVSHEYGVSMHEYPKPLPQARYGASICRWNLKMHGLLMVNGRWYLQASISIYHKMH
ncbi:hypothetical protein EV356DRAFT_502501 [Viridothelium virens]|uniref:Uncharacterized protein n=1 Tax=Viridothelium virens TaxID=1048519 RepID=A0A6A6H824_VIRVR|nr:hypothetical protein EV356DRAFT_502501 [Viridothelium virens]